MRTRATLRAEKKESQRACAKIAWNHILKR